MHIRSAICFAVSLVLICFVIPNFARASQTNGTIESSGNAGYAWSNNAGWVNFALPGGNIHVTDTGLTGSAWSSNYGWINLAPTNGGVNNAEGTLSGNAWGAGLGWIDFSGVTINSGGNFTGSASSLAIGTLTFDCTNCDVHTDWRPASVRGSGGIVGGSFISAPTMPSTSTTPDPIKDSVYNILDFNAMMVNWGNQTCGNSADMNGDCVVDILDFNLLMVLWETTY